MYLSRLILNPRSRRVQRELAEPYEMHRSLMRSFPDDLAAGGERVLFRVEDHPRLEAPSVIVQSLALPDWLWLAEEGARGYLLPADEPNPAVKSFTLHLDAGQVLAFRLLANPTFKTKQDGRPVRQGILKEEDQRAWLDRKGQMGGFRVVSVRLSSYSLIAAGRLKKDEVTHRPHLLSVLYDGVLQVTDPACVAETVRQGIGSAKGFGFGLLSLAAVPRQ